VVPLTENEKTEGTLGEWIAAHPEQSDQNTWDYGYGETPGVLKAAEDLDPVELVPTLAHELGHACSTLEDRELTASPDSEWDSELAADRYAYKWGFGRGIARLRKIRHSLHHGPGPRQVIKYDRFWFRVTRDFRFVRLPRRPAKKKGKK
jgi:hypothetical protein